MIDEIKYMEKKAVLILLAHNTSHLVALMFSHSMFGVPFAGDLVMSALY
jgi:hypothetical protein